MCYGKDPELKEGYLSASKGLYRIYLEMKLFYFFGTWQELQRNLPVKCRNARAINC